MTILEIFWWAATCIAFSAYMRERRRRIEAESMNGWLEREAVRWHGKYMESTRMMIEKHTDAGSR